MLKLSGASGLATAPLATVPPSRPATRCRRRQRRRHGRHPKRGGGVVSATGQSITASDESTGSAEQLTGLIEVNADIEAGDSGGPLLPHRVK